MDNSKQQGRRCLKMICKNHERQCLFSMGQCCAVSIINRKSPEHRALHRIQGIFYGIC